MPDSFLHERSDFESPEKGLYNFCLTVRAIRNVRVC